MDVSAPLFVESQNLWQQQKIRVFHLIVPSYGSITGKAFHISMKICCVVIRALARHLVQQRSGGKAQYKNNAPEVDHIFPRSELKKKRFNPAKIDYVANFWILAKGKNQNKSSMHPKKYFRDVSPSDLKRALIQRNMLDYGKYNAFLKMRAKAILKIVGSALSLSENDFVRAKGRE